MMIINFSKQPDDGRNSFSHWRISGDEWRAKRIWLYGGKPSLPQGGRGGWRTVWYSRV